MSSRLLIFGLMVSSQIALAAFGAGPSLVGQWQFAKAECSSGAPAAFMKDMPGSTLEPIVISADQMNFEFKGLQVPNNGTVLTCDLKVTFPYATEESILKIAKASGSSTNCPIKLSMDETDATDPRFEVSEDTFKMINREAASKTDEECPIGDILTVTFTRIK